MVSKAKLEAEEDAAIEEADEDDSEEDEENYNYEEKINKEDMMEIKKMTEEEK